MPVLWITEQDVAAHLRIGDAVPELAAAFRSLAVGAARTLPKSHLAWPDGIDPLPLATLHSISGVLPDRSIAGTKTWVHTPRGSRPVVILFDTRDGSLLAVLEAFVLGQVRTAAVSALATDLLAPSPASTMVIVGTGRQALPQVAAVAAVRPSLKRVIAIGRYADRTRAFADRAAAALDLDVVVGTSVTSAVADAQVVTLATRATSAVLPTECVHDGLHINAIGAITPERAEFEPSLAGRCRVVAVDSVAQARALSQELRAAFGADEDAWARVRDLGSLLADSGGEPASAGPTLFKALGIGLADTALAALAYARVVGAGAGTPLPASNEDADVVAPFQVKPSGGEHAATR
jgi:alanine dehydrogenase